MPDTLPLKPIDAELSEKLKHTIDQRAELRDALKPIVSAGLSNVVFIGAGGSLIASYAAHYLLEREALFPVFKIQSDEFNTMLPKRFGKGTVAFLASHTGTTKETVAAAKNAKALGATVFAVTKADSALASEVDHVFLGESDLFYLIAAYALMELTSVQRNWADVDAFLENYPTAAVHACEQNEPAAEAIALALMDAPETMVLGSGPSAGWAYGLAMCYLQEMQWKSASSFNSGEFFQGAFEMIDDNSAVINIIGEDASRPMALRAQKFLKTYATKNTHEVDVAKLELPGIPKPMRADASPLLVALLMGRIAKHYEAVRGHDLEQRRYMFKVEY